MRDFLDDDTPLGDLARHMYAHAEFPEGLHTSDEILACFRETQWYSQMNYADLKRAIALYMQFGSLK
ncbi:sterile alpha motif-like domain-containing protein [Staphylococcus ratti]|uniref:Sterile alpha motif-like domain-containing protein n=2 Tax=Staphylococcus ratti TaxID=2892440 RepID=A0ABY3PDD7_9STAP|nr:sterile alpha motif-like domain-containing protein [Staphylococcus ratti]